MQSNGFQRREFLKSTALACGAVAAGPLLAAGKGALPLGQTNSRRVRYALEGRAAVYAHAVTEQWLKVAPASNPAMLEMFRDRDRKPLRDMVPWAGEFAGKYLTSAMQVFRLTDDLTLKATIASFVRQLISLQAEDGYLGPWPKDSRLTGHAPNSGPKGGDTWDAWGHYHVMLGLLLWHEETRDEEALACVKRIGDLFCRKFESARLVDTGSTEMNLAPVHSLCLLHRRTGEEKYLKLALKIVDEFAARDPAGKLLAGDYLNAALEGKEFYQLPKPRWESLHPILGLAELHRITGDERYRKAFEHLWWSIVKLDRHNNGGFSSGEQAQGNPYHKGAIETCCTIAWTAMSVEMLRLSRNSIVADELELSTWNSVVGMHSPNGRWVTYNTPMDGTRKASAHDIVFQARAGSPELNCCSVNGARGFGMIADWAVVEEGDGIYVNWYGPGKFSVPMRSGEVFGLRQDTSYPASNHVRLTVNMPKGEKVALHLRIPHWSERTVVRLNKSPLHDVKAGTYLSLDRTWAPRDTVEIEFDFAPRFWKGERECAGLASIYRGPLLLTYDRRFNEVDPDDVPELDAAALTLKPTLWKDWLPPLLLMEAKAIDGRIVRLCDFGSAGVGGSPYRSWLKVSGVTDAPFSRENPLRAAAVRA